MPKVPAKTKRKPAKVKITTRARGAKPRTETYTFKSSWVLDDEAGKQNRIEVETMLDAATLSHEVTHLAAQVKLLQSEYESLAEQHAYLLRDSVRQAATLAAYRTKRADELEKVAGTVALAT